MAGAPGLRLGGPRAYAGETCEGAWLGDGRADAGPADIDRALKIFHSSERHFVLLNIWMSHPSSMPLGCGLISFGRGGSLSEDREKTTCLPWGSVKVINT